MAKIFARIEVTDDSGDCEIVLIDLARISLCTIRTEDDGSQSYDILDASDQEIASFDVNDMQAVVEAIERATRAESWGDVPD